MGYNYSKYYSEESLWEKIRRYSKKAGAKVVYVVLLLYYIMVSKDVSLKTKALIAAALGYFIFPMDAIPDLSPLIGFSDDLGVLLFALSQVSGNITPEIKSQARKKMNEWFGPDIGGELKDIEGKIG
ncbi:hypothetical protein MNBD_BACTEROID01-986 [hydrothermal vent metagenome]|uniref:DUF1232 domain-containing protein n=1 Tax=hydrothermal vent metagenome TaxID=652676 RepID=A0A3B0U922_9ZZZZ